jgi:hypothetical protein
MIDAQQMGWKTPTTVLAFMAVARQHVATAKMNFLLRQPIEREQANDAGDLNLEVYCFDPIVFGSFDFGTQFAHFAPRDEGIRGEPALLHRNHLGQLAAEQPKGPPYVHHVDRHVEPIEHQNAARECAAGGGGGGGSVRGNNAPASRVMHPRGVNVGCMKALHVPPPELCQSRHCSQFSGRIPARTMKFRGRTVARCRVRRTQRAPPIRRRFGQNSLACVRPTLRRASSDFVRNSEFGRFLREWSNARTTNER